MYYGSLLKQYEKTFLTLQTQREHLITQLEVHHKYEKQLDQDYESTFQKYQDSLDKTLNTMFPHVMRLLGKGIKNLF